MSGPPAPQLDDLLERPFSFYPPIINIEHNEWLLLRGTWSEMLVRNTKSGEEIWIPRSYFREISSIDEPVMIVGLNRELEYRAGSVWPHARKVFDMPRTAAPVGPQAPEPKAPEPSGFERIGGIGASGTDVRIGRMIGVVFAGVLGVAALVYAIAVLTPKTKPTYAAKDQSYLLLTRDDDYFSVVRKLGQPNEEVWRSGAGELQYERLTFGDRGYSIILMGTDRPAARYIGTLSKDWQPLHYVEFAHGASTAPMLRGLKRF
jgi:hypothetical protein